MWNIGVVSPPPVAIISPEITSDLGLLFFWENALPKKMQNLPIELSVLQARTLYAYLSYLIYPLR